MAITTEAAVFTATKRKQKGFCDTGKYVTEGFPQRKDQLLVL
jgi:hypothetical protein